MPSSSVITNPGRVTTGGIDSQSPYHDKRIQAALSTQIIIKAQGYDNQWYDVGAIQSFQVSESRNINPLQEVGTDGIIQLHPSGASPIQLSVTRAIFDYQRMTAAFQRGFHHVMSQRFPFDILVMDYNPYVFKDRTLNFDQARTASIPAGRTIRTRFINCWFSANAYTYSATEYQIVENATLVAEAVYDQGLVGTIAQSGQDDVETAHDRTFLGSVMTESYVAIPGDLRGAAGLG
jgi:hypothetical protein